VIIPTFISLLFAILLSLHLVTFLMFFITCLCHLLAAGACLSWGLPSHSSRSLFSDLSVLPSVYDSGISYTGSISQRITDPSIRTSTESTLLWMYDKASSPCLKTGGTHRPRHSKSVDIILYTFVHLFLHSDIFIFVIGTYLSLFKCLVRLTTQRIRQFSFSSEGRRYKKNLPVLRVPGLIPLRCFLAPH